MLLQNILALNGCHHITLLPYRLVGSHNREIKKFFSHLAYHSFDLQAFCRRLSDSSFFKTYKSSATPGPCGLPVNALRTGCAIATNFTANVAAISCKMSLRFSIVYISQCSNLSMSVRITKYPCSVCGTKNVFPSMQTCLS